MKKNLLFITLLLAISTTMCKKDNDEEYTPDFTHSEGLQMADTLGYQSLPNNEHSIDSMGISGDTLTIKFSAYGSDGLSWQTAFTSNRRTLIDPNADSIAERNVRLSLENEEAPSFNISQTVQFDLSPLRVDSCNTVKLLFRDKQSVTYVY